MRQRLASITQWLHPSSVCVLCNQTNRISSAVCIECKKMLTPLGVACSRCALPWVGPTSATGSALLCGQCCYKKPKIDRVFTAYRFEEPLRTLLHQFKYHDGLYLTVWLGQLIVEALNDDALQTQCLIPVPLHRKKLQQRGFNQAAELAKYLARRLRIPYQSNLCKRIMHTNSQVSSDAKHRAENIKQAFVAKPSPFQHVTLVDDLITTGSTANELASLLKQQGIKQVNLWCCARTV